MSESSIIVLTGGIGGAKLVLGLTKIMPPENITAIVNTGDDFKHLGLHISPDIDTLLYTLSGLSNKDLGWGRADETWNFMSALSQIGGEDWFSLGDKDLALHIERSHRLNNAESLTSITQHFAKKFGLKSDILPMTDQSVSTMIETDQGLLAFQDYFVRLRCEPHLKSVAFKGAEQAKLTRETIAALSRKDISAIIIAPSNPWLSIDPILSVPGMKQTLKNASAPIIAVTPLPGGKAVKGPTAKIMSELSIPLSLNSILKHYGDLIDGVLLDNKDIDTPNDLPFAQCDTIMTSLEDRIHVAQMALKLAKRIKG